jgi:anti-anti-sigma factor
MITLMSFAGATLRIRLLPDADTTIRLHGELDMASTDVVDAAADLVPGNADVVTVDLTDLQFVDGSGAEALAAFHAAQVVRGRKVRLIRPRPCVRRVLELLGMGSLLTGKRPQLEHSRISDPTP